MASVVILTRRMSGIILDRHLLGIPETHRPDFLRFLQDLQSVSGHECDPNDPAGMDIQLPLPTRAWQWMGVRVLTVGP
jgi:hypothetical protein